MKNSVLDIKRLFRAFGYSLNGLKSAWHGEAAFRQEILLAIFLVPLGYYLADNKLELAVLCASLAMLLIAELVNSAIESIVDYISTEHRPLAGRAKDMGSAAVLLAIVQMLVVWLLVIFE